jgi:hypothetical protein
MHCQDLKIYGSEREKFVTAGHLPRNLPAFVTTGDDRSSANNNGWNDDLEEQPEMAPVHA